MNGAFPHVWDWETDPNIIFRSHDFSRNGSGLIEIWAACVSPRNPADALACLLGRRRQTRVIKELEIARVWALTLGLRAAGDKCTGFKLSAVLLHRDVTMLRSLCHMNPFSCRSFDMFFFLFMINLINVVMLRLIHFRFLYHYLYQTNQLSSIFPKLFNYKRDLDEVYGAVLSATNNTLPCKHDHTEKKPGSLGV